ncbi:hypothetical protein MSAN_00629100 [Mycena sanguinolenta]|uniref:Uncharacterized protein n=1 Tax=Mycena sanguinolenta TaxID=230812 RepID=A0A8H6Z366_9AGAR|nr:hypothetical protein MSAN_00629100 [Mycena sanguinolenta]
MGGFVSSDGHPIATEKQLRNRHRHVGSKFQEAIRNVDKEEITDKSKGDALSKGVALLQGLWFVAQCVARVHQHLTITQLEVATLAFAIVNIFIWLLWWNKPLHVQRPIVVGPPTRPNTETITFRVQPPRSVRILGAIFGHYGREYNPSSSDSVPSFWSVQEESDHSIAAGLLLILMGAVFGAIHCAAWNAIFPTPAEMRIWRASSLVIIAVPCIPYFLSPLAINEDNWEYMVAVMVRLGIPIYVSARIILIVLPLIELRLLPASAFVDVDWSTYIPHI